MPEKKTQPKATKPKLAAKDSAVGKQDKKVFDEVSSEGQTNATHITHVTKNRARPPKKAPPSRALRHQQAEESERTMYATGVIVPNGGPQPKTSAPLVTTTTTKSQAPSNANQNVRTNANIRKMQQEDHGNVSESDSNSSMEGLYTVNTDDAVTAPVTVRRISAGVDNTTSPSTADNLAMSGMIGDKQDATMTLREAMEVLRQAKAAREKALQELAEAERKRAEADATKKQALEILRMAREAIKQLK